MRLQTTSIVVSNDFINLTNIDLYMFPQGDMNHGHLKVGFAWATSTQQLQSVATASTYRFLLFQIDID